MTKSITRKTMVSFASDLAERGRGWVDCLAFHFQLFYWPSSPYTSHFLSADTIVPGYTNPQNLNRYSYVSNNPLLYTDPTGHMMAVDDGGGHCDLNCVHVHNQNHPHGGGGNGGGVHCNNDPDCSGRDLDSAGALCVPGDLVCQLSNAPYQGYDLSDFCPLSSTLVECYDQNLPLSMGNGSLYIHPDEFDALLSAIRDNAHGKSFWWGLAHASSFDTPFYDHSVYGLGRLSGTGCIGTKCYNRSELNYIAEGELWAAAGASKPQTHAIVWTWKLSPVMHWPTIPSGGTIEMTDFGYNDYNSFYP